MEEFLDSHATKPAQKVVWGGTDELWEVKAQHAGDTFRLLGFFDGPQLVVLVSGFA